MLQQTLQQALRPVSHRSAMRIPCFSNARPSYRALLPLLHLLGPRSVELRTLAFLRGYIKGTSEPSYRDQWCDPVSSYQ